VENIIIAMVGGFSKKETHVFLFLLILFLSCFTLAGCASSEVSRDAASNIDMGMQNAKGLADGDMDIADAYQNSHQATKGALIGGATGAIAGAFTSGVGAIEGAAIGTVLGASYGAYIDSMTTLTDQLENRGVAIVALGDQVLIVMSSSRLFYPMTSTIKPQSYSTLQLVANYINSYTKMLVKVTGYTNDTGSCSVDQVLSQQQAEQVSKLLQASGVDARLLYAVGEGGTHLVQSQKLEWGSSDNYRIEITLEKLYV
jgi:outer membrane protein OmpA-like peptidoglycan-associated protein